MNEIDKVRSILISATGEHHYDVEMMAAMALDIIRGDRLTIKILSRNIESLTMQMKGITQVTFERDQLKEVIKLYKDKIKYFEERLAQYEKD